MGIKTKSELAAYFNTGDKPTEAQFADTIDTFVAQPSGATYPAIIECESTASATSRGVGAFGIAILAANTSASGQSLVGVPELSTAGRALVSASTTAAQRALLGIASVPSTPDVDWITGQIDTPASGQYVLDQYAPVAYTIEWLTAKLSAGACDVTGQINTTNITGLVSATQGATEVRSSATGANAVVVGDTVRLLVTNVSSPALLSFTMKIVRT